MTQLTFDIHIGINCKSVVLVCGGNLVVGYHYKIHTEEEEGRKEEEEELEEEEEEEKVEEKEEE